MLGECNKILKYIAKNNNNKNLKFYKYNEKIILDLWYEARCLGLEDSDIVEYFNYYKDELDIRNDKDGHLMNCNCWFFRKLFGFHVIFDLHGRLRISGEDKANIVSKFKELNTLELDYPIRLSEIVTVTLKELINESLIAIFFKKERYFSQKKVNQYYNKLDHFIENPEAFKYDMDMANKDIIYEK